MTSSKPVSQVSNGVKLRRGLLESINEPTNDGAHVPATGLYASNEAYWPRARAWTCHRHAGTVSVQMAFEPYPQDTPQNTAWKLAMMIEEDIADFQHQNPGEPHLEEAARDADFLKRRAASNTHTVGPKHLNQFIHSALEADLPPGAISRMITALAGYDLLVVRHLLARNMKKWRQAADETQTKKLAHAAASLDIDPYAVLSIISAMGHRPADLPHLNPNTTQETRHLIEEMAQEANIPHHIIPRLQEAL